MSPDPTATLQRTFALDSVILADGSAAALDLSASTDADVAVAVVGNTPFPRRPNGEIGLGHIGLTVAGEHPVAFTGGRTTVGFEFAAGITAGAAIFDRPERAIAALDLGVPPGLELSLGSSPGARYALLRAGYTAKGSVEGAHPIGGLGSLTFGLSGAASGVSGVLHRFTDETGAGTVLERTVRSWKLPRHVDSADRLEPGTWVIGRADGSLAVTLAANLGFNFNFVREAKLAGLSGDIGLKIDAAAAATFGFAVSGRYLVVLARESESPHLRLQLFKLSRNGFQAGLNLKIGIKGVERVTPDSVDDFVAAVFGVHGAQIIEALKHLEAWTDPARSVGQLVAGLVNDKALELLKAVTDIDPATALDAARQQLLDAIALYDALPTRASSELWTVLGRLDEDSAATFRNTLLLLASADAAVQARALKDLLSTNGFATTPAGRIISALADRGLLTLPDRLPELQSTAETIVSLLDGGVIAKLQAFVADRLDLRKVLATITEADFDALDAFLIGRLSAFFDKELHFADLNAIKDSIGLVVKKRGEVHAKVKNALNSRYGFELATTWQKTTARTALLDVVFDTSQAEGRALLASVLRDADLDTLMVTRSPAIQIHSAVLTHELTRKTTVDLALPHFRFQSESFNTSMARVTAEDDGGRVLLFDATGQDVVAVRKKFQSSLSVSIAAAVSDVSHARFKDLRVHSRDAGSWSYQLRHARSGMRRAELEAYTRPFITRYMADQFTGGMNLSTWYTEFDRTVEEVLANGPEEFGDVCATFDVTMPAETLGAWVIPKPDVTLAAKTISKAIQRALKEVLPFYYLTDISRLLDLASSAALLGWAAIRPSNDIRVHGDHVTFDVGKRVFWDHVDPEHRRRMLANPATGQRLLARLPPLRLRLEEAGMHGVLPFYEDNEVSAILTTAAGSGDVLVRSLLTFEAVIVHKAAEALRDIQDFLAVADSSPGKAIDRLAEFAADMTTAFHKLTGNSLFGGVSFRAVSQTVFAEASRALDPGLLAEPRAMLALAVLKPVSQRAFNIADFLTGAIPPDQDIAVAQRLVSA